MKPMQFSNARSNKTKSINIRTSCLREGADQPL